MTFLIFQQVKEVKSVALWLGFTKLQLPLVVRMKTMNNHIECGLKFKLFYSNSLETV